MPQDPSGIFTRGNQEADDSQGRAQSEGSQSAAAAVPPPPPPLFRDVPPGGGPAFKDQVQTVANAATGDVQHPPSQDPHRRGTRHPQDPPVVSQKKASPELPKPAAFLDVAPGTDKGPSFKDQVRTAQRPAAQRNDGSPAAVRDEPLARLPNQGPPLPLFKDQVAGTKDRQIPGNAIGAHNVSPSGHRLPDIVQDSPELPTEMAPSPLISAHVVGDEEAAAPQNNVYEAQALVGGVLVFLNRRCMIAASIILLVVAATIGGVCGAGLCSSGSKITTVIMTSTSPPTIPSTPAPTPKPTPAPTIGPEAQVVVDFINSVTFAVEEITYPFQLSSATPEQLALRWLVDEDPLGLSVENKADQNRLIQRYALLTFWYSTNGKAWSANDKWLETEDECTWFGVTCNLNSVVIQIGTEEENLAGNNLVGHIPQDLFQLKSMRSIAAANNPYLTGPIPPSIGTLSDLTSVYLNGCGLNGYVCLSFDNLTIFLSVVGLLAFLLQLLTVQLQYIYVFSCADRYLIVSVN